MNSFSHIDEQGNAAMVDVGRKEITHRTATARSIIALPKEVLEKFTGNDIQTKKVLYFKQLLLPVLWPQRKRVSLYLYAIP